MFGNTFLKIILIENHEYNQTIITRFFYPFDDLCRLVQPQPGRQKGRGDQG
jgi:hypothetical protein